MGEPAWMTKYQAREALKNGSPEEAHRLLDSLIVSGDRRVWALRADVVKGYVDRAERALRRDDVEAAWKDLMRVGSLAEQDPGVAKLRDTLVKFSLAEIKAMLEAGKPLVAIEAINQLRERPANPPALAPLEEAARAWQAAIDAADKGEMPQARPFLDQTRERLANRTSGLNRYEEQLNQREDRFKVLWPQLQQATRAADWREMIRIADELLLIAPRHREAQQARNRAWQVMQPDPVAQGKLDSTTAKSNPPPLPSPSAGPIPKRFFLWIDGVGAYLVCTGSRVSIGMATGDGPVDVPLFADVSRIHAQLTRDAECYMIEAGQAVLLNSSSIDKSVLQNGDRIIMGNACQMIFDLPVPGSLSARVMHTSGRRLPMAVDGVLLMADMLVMGKGERCHVQIPNLERPIYIVKQKDELIVKWDGDFKIEGTPHTDKAPLPKAGTVTTDPVTFAIEPVK